MVSVVDLVKDSLTHLLTVSFGKSSSPSYPLAVNVAQGADKYDEILLGKNPVHFVAFAKNRDGAARAMALLHYISDWKSTQIYGGGKVLQNYYRVSEVLRCYLEAVACDDWKAHCYSVIDDPFYERKERSNSGFTIFFSTDSTTQKEEWIDEYIFPCTLLQPNFHHRTSRHPSDPIHQIQAEGIGIGCDLCPLFDAGGYSKVGQRNRHCF